MAPVGRTVATNGPLRLVRVAQPLRTLWGAGGFGDDGWSNPTTTPFVRLYSSPETAGRRVVVALTVTAPASAIHPRRVDVRGSIGNAGGWAPAGGAVTITVRVCVPRSKARDLGLIVHGSTRVDGRPTGIALLTADVKPDGVCGHRAAP